MTDKEHRSVNRHRRQAQKYRNLAQAHEQMALTLEEDLDQPLLFEDIPRDRPLTWYREQAETYRAKEEQEEALATLEYEVAQTAWLAKFPVERQLEIREMHADSLKEMIELHEQQIAELKAELQFWKPY